jgi:putrescine---pyruvate transaminase
VTHDHPLWHPFADMGRVASEKLTLESADGVWITDDQGRRYLDATASLWYSNVGHGRMEVARAVAEQLERLDAYSIFGDYANRPALELAERLAALSPMPETRVFLGSGGGDVIDSAAKIARASFALRGEPQRTHLISRRLGYHGTHGAGTSLGGIEANRTGWGPLLPDVSVVDFDDAAALEREIERVGSDRVAAFFCEPVIGAGGVQLPPEGYIEATADICARHGVLFVADCVICGFGRLGTWLGIDRWPVTPDMIALAKGISGGTLPLGALLVRGEVAAPWFTGRPGAPMLRHGQTYAGHPACCVAALTTLDILERERLIPRGRELEQPLAAVLEPVRTDPLVGDLRAGLGLLAGIDLADGVLERVPGAVGEFHRACRDVGVLVRPLLRGIAVSPPLTITVRELEQLGELIIAGLEQLRARLPAGALHFADLT